MTNRRPAKCGERGFALLVVFLMAAMVAITLYLEIPRVAFESQRNREEMLVERGEQYKRAIELYYRKTKRYPQKIEDLENTNNFRFLRRRYMDPLTGKDEWRMVHMGPAGLTDSLVEKMPGTDADKKDGKSETASTGTDPNAPKGPDDIAASANRADRDQRALAAQRGAGGGGAAAFDPNDPNASAAANAPPVDPNEAFQKQQLQEFARQQALQQQQQQAAAGGLPQNPNSPENPGAPPMTNMNLGNGTDGNPQQPQPPQNGLPQQFPVNPNNSPFFPNNNNNQFPPIGSPNGPVRTLYNPTQPPFNPGNAMMRGAIPNPAGNVANSQTGGAAQPYNQSGSNPAFNVPQAVRDQLTRPSGRPQMGSPQQQQFGGAGIAGVASNATGSGIKRYNERAKYKEWEFVYDYRKPAKGAQKGVTGVGGLKTTDGQSQQQQQQQPGFGNNNSGFGNSNSGFGNNSGFGGNPRRP
jgi:type II secretory pathway pseudopilin PulG